MKHIKTFESEYSDEEILDMSGDLNKIGASDWEGWWITEVFKYSDGIEGSAYAIVGDGWKSLIKISLQSRGIEEYENVFKDVSSWEDFFQILEDEVEDPYDRIQREFKAIKMTPRTLKNQIDICDLLDTMEVLKLGRKYFSNFDSAV